MFRLRTLSATLVPSSARGDAEHQASLQEILVDGRRHTIQKTNAVTFTEKTAPSLEAIVRMAIKPVEHHGKSDCDEHYLLAS